MRLDPEEEWRGLAEKEMVPVADRITPQAFLDWKVKFEAEMVEAGVIKREAVKGKTGKIIWMEMQSQQKEQEKESGSTDADAKQGMLVYDAALFGDDDEDLDDLSDDE